MLPSLTIDIDYPTASSPGNYIAADSWGMVDYEPNTHVIDCPQKEKIEKLAAKLDGKGELLTEKLTIIERRIAGLDRMIGERLASE